MEFIKRFEFCLFIGAINLFVYSIVFVNLTATFVFSILGRNEKDIENVDTREEMYFNCYKIILLIFVFAMIITSINLIRGIIKKSIPLILPWLAMSACVLLYQFQFLLDQIVYWISFGYIQQPLETISELLIIFVLKIFCVKRVFQFCKSLFTQNIQQQRTSIISTQNYHENISYNDSSVFVPLNIDEEFDKHYINTVEVNNDYEI